MTSIQITGWERDTLDYNGKQQAEVFYVVIDGKKKALSKADLLRTIRINLPEAGADDPRLTNAAMAEGNGR